MQPQELEKAYKAMKEAKSYTAFKDRKKHYERLLRKARKEEAWTRSSTATHTSS